MVIAISALQGDFQEHEAAIRQLGVETIQIRQKKDLAQKFDALSLPGGESTVQGRLMRELDIFDDLKARIADGLPVLATCAGLILLAQEISGDTTRHLGTLDVTVKRNAYGRQIDSFYTQGYFIPQGKNIPMSFIRAPRIERVGKDVEIIAEHNGIPVAVKQKKQLAMAFHPELCEDNAILRFFIDLVNS